MNILNKIYFVLLALVLVLCVLALVFGKILAGVFGLLVLGASLLYSFSASRKIKLIALIFDIVFALLYIVLSLLK